MRILFAHQNFPGQYLHLARHLAAQQRHELVFLTEANRNEIAGVRKIAYRKPAPAASQTHWVAREFDGAARRAEIVALAARQLKDLGFRPDIILGHHGWGELLNIRDVWPETPLLGYFEFFYHTRGADVGFDPEFPTPEADFPRVRAKNNTNLQALALGGDGQTPTRWQMSTYPAWARERMTLLAEGVDLDVCRPDPAVRATPLKIGKLEIRPEHPLVTYVARDLEPYRGFHIFMRALPEILAARPDARVVLVGADGVSYGARPAEGTWRERMMAEQGARIDMSRVAFPGRVDYATHVRLLQRSDAHVYLSYPFVASWSLREALACGAPVIGADIEMVREFVRHERTGLLTPFHEPRLLAQAVLRLLEERALARRLGQAARRFAVASLDLRAYLGAYESLIDRLSAGALSASTLPAGTLPASTLSAGTQAGRKRAATKASSVRAARTAASPAASAVRTSTSRKKPVSPRARA